MSEELTDAGAILLGLNESEGESQQAETDPPEMATPDESQQEQEIAPPPDEPEEKEPDLSTLLEKAELDPKDFYNLKVPGTESTFGEAKDALQEQNDFALKAAQQESDLQDRENGILAKAREASQLYELLPDELKTPEVTQRFNDIKTQEIQRENQATLTAIPEWRDPLKATADREQIAELMKGYGYSDAEIGGMYGSRELKAWYDYAKLKALVSKIPEKQVKTKSKSPSSKRQSAKSAPIEGATEAGTILLKALAKGN